MESYRTIKRFFNESKALSLKKELLSILILLILFLTASIASNTSMSFSNEAIRVSYSAIFAVSRYFLNNLKITSTIPISKASFKTIKISFKESNILSLKNWFIKVIIVYDV